jgi:hypothetical protein
MPQRNYIPQICEIHRDSREKLTWIRVNLCSINDDSQEMRRLGKILSEESIEKWKAIENFGSKKMKIWQNPYKARDERVGNVRKCKPKKMKTYAARRWRLEKWRFDRRKKEITIKK